MYDVFVLRKDEFNKFVEKLDNDSKGRLVRDITFLKEKGSDLQMPFAEKIDRKLWELRTSGKQKVRVIYTIVGLQIYVLNWFIKKTQKTPIRELNTANRRLTEI